MRWAVSWRADPEVKPIADGHYNRQNKDSAQFVPPGRCLVLKAKTMIGRAFFVTSYPFAEYVKHRRAGSWVCSAFRNEGAALSSELIREALAATLWRWPKPPSVGAWKMRRRNWKRGDTTFMEGARTDIERIRIAMVTFVDDTKTLPKMDPGHCFRRARFVEIGATKDDLVALGLRVEDLPAAAPPMGAQTSLLEMSA